MGVQAPRNKQGAKTGRIEAPIMRFLTSKREKRHRFISGGERVTARGSHCAADHFSPQKHALTPVKAYPTVASVPVRRRYEKDHEFGEESLERTWVCEGNTVREGRLSEAANKG